MIVNPGIRRFLGSAIQRLFNSASFSAPLTHSLVLERGTGSPSFTRASTATVMGYGPTANPGDDAILLTVAANEARFEGARRISEGVWSNTFADGSLIPAATNTGYLAETADVLAYPTASNILAAASTVYLEFTPDHTPSGTIALWGTYVDASNYTAILHDATNMIMRKRIAGVNYDATIANAFVSGTTYKACATWGASGTSITLNGTEGTPDANTTAAQIAATMQIGADGNGAQQPFASERNVRVWQRQVSEAERISITGPLDAAYLLSSPIDSAVVIAAGAPAYSVGAIEIDSVAAGNGSVEIISNWRLT